MPFSSAPNPGRLSLPLWQEQYAAPLAPMTRREMLERGWDAVDVVFVTGDAYVDHPSFAMAILTRVLESAGFRVAVLSQPDWHSCEPWRQFGRPRLFFAISAGNMDSLINHYTANKKVRNDDAYSPGGRIGLRPDRATLPYCHRAREAFPGVPIIAGGVEASLRRLAHYDYWSDTVRRSTLHAPRLTPHAPRFFLEYALVQRGLLLRMMCAVVSVTRVADQLFSNQEVL